ncbi:Hypothetical predicted protein, partial [Marmota monax]
TDRAPMGTGGSCAYNDPGRQHVWKSSSLPRGIRINSSTHTASVDTANVLQTQ